MKTRDKAYRRWKDRMKYVSRLKKVLYYWGVEDKNAPNKWRKAKNWKELDTPDSKAKQYKTITRKWSYMYDKIESHIRNKKQRKEGKDISNNFLKT